jgi:hypothetical protein
MAWSLMPSNVQDGIINDTKQTIRVRGSVPEPQIRLRFDTQIGDLVVHLLSAIFAAVAPEEGDVRGAGKPDAWAALPVLIVVVAR